MKVRNLHKSFENKLSILNGIDITLPKGSWTSIIGPSGVGKSTLLHCLSGLLMPDEGKVYFDDVDLFGLQEKQRSDYRRFNIGFIFQDYKLLPYYSVLDNVMLPLMYDRPKKELYPIAVDLLKRVGINENLFKRLPNGLSGGEKQRVAIARALIANPATLFCDEPTGNLDEQNRDRVVNLLKSLKEEGKRIILVTHDLEVASHSDQLFRLSTGKLINEGVLL
ncbi:ABC transporter ATP-binding protein [Aquibacillus kalidii]|uniref:ABC transporter ATP-binding protein n=1 Tax=Aquibacillus kalidii TaxID=2762597 RepID=UPI001646BBB7|nr:ABC transporter ATP-binding protein [Aquibacillus kalidii]